MSLDADLARISADLKKRTEDLQSQLDDSTAEGSVSELLLRIEKLKERIAATQQVSFSSRKVTG